MPKNLKEIIDKEITIDDIRKMNFKEKIRYYSGNWACHIVLWPGWIGGPAGTFINTFINKGGAENVRYSPVNILNYVLAPFLAGAAIASALRTGYCIARDYRKIKNIKK